MNRREFITLLGGVAASWPLAAGAQQSGKVYRVGFLGVTSEAEYARQVEALKRGLRQLGYEEGKTSLSSIGGLRADTTAFRTSPPNWSSSVLRYLLPTVRPAYARRSRPPRPFRL
jgi:hypothetical protein